MIDLTLNRIIESTNSTAGVLWHGDTNLGIIIEDGFRKVKEYGLTRIPPGRYKIAKRKAGRFYEKYKLKYSHEWVPHLLEVPGFEYILIHIGNSPKDSKGCLLINSGLHYNGNWIGSGSEAAYLKLYAYLDGLDDDEMYITIQ